MKVVALIPKRYASNSLLVEMTPLELGLIVDGQEVVREAPVGTEFRVCQHWQRVRDIDQAQRKLTASAGSLRALAELLETIPVVVPPSEPEPAKEGGAA